MVTIYLENGATKAYLCNQSGTSSLFLSRLDCHILNLGNKHVIALIVAYTHTHFNVEANYLLQGRWVPEWYLLPHIAQEVYQLWGQPGVDLFASSCTNQCKHYYTLERILW